MEDLTFHSFEIEGVEKGSNIPQGVIVGEIKEISKHPNADKLQLVKVDVGKKTSSLPSPHEEGALDVVCGAWNIKTGDKVPLALVGTKLPNGIEIKAAEIRGEKSFGMLCAQDELGLGEDHSGIIILPIAAKIGEPVGKYLGKNDETFEIKVLPDRAHDVLSYVGVAREIAVLEGRKFDYDFDGLKLPKIKKSEKNKILSVEIKDKTLCPRYIGAVMTGIEIKESPDWIKRKLEVSGIKAINNVVDATNLIMLELGNPLHAFDANRIADKKQIKIVVRKANDKEKMTLLDDSEIELSEKDLLITNGSVPLALAGIMGGKESGIGEDTRTIVLEAANFQPANIRRSRTRLGVKTESSDRFEKGLDPNLAEKAMVRLIEIIEHTANGKLEEIVDVYPKPVKPLKIKLNLDYVNSLLGENIPIGAVKKILTLLNFKVSGGGKFLAVEVPTFRVDARTQEDLIEEIGRIWGYEKIKEQPINENNAPAVKNEQVFFERKIQDILTGLGYDEIYNYSFYSKKDVEICKLNEIKHYELANPMNPDQELVRVSLIPNILKNIRENLKHYPSFRLFEVGRSYYPNNNKTEEKRMLVMAEVLEKDAKADTFFSLKGDVESFLEVNGIKNVQFVNLEAKLPSVCHPARFAKIKIGDDVIGGIGEINPLVLEQYKIKKRAVMAEFDLEILRKYASKEKIYKSLPKFPIVMRDISMLDKSGMTVAEISNFIKKAGGKLVISVELFDIFQKDGSVSYAFHIHFGTDRTLEGKEIDEMMNEIISRLEKELQMEIRK